MSMLAPAPGYPGGIIPYIAASWWLGSMAAMDPNHQLAAMYGMMPPGYPGAGANMDMFNKGKHSPSSKDAKSLPSPSHRPREGPSPRPPSRASASSRDGRSTPSRSSAPQTSHSQSSPRTSSAASASASAPQTSHSQSSPRTSSA